MTMLFTPAPYNSSRYSDSSQGRWISDAEVPGGGTVEYATLGGDGRSETRLIMGGSTRCLKKGTTYYIALIMRHWLEPASGWALFWQCKSETDDISKLTPHVAIDRDPATDGSRWCINRGSGQWDEKLITADEMSELRGKLMFVIMELRFDQANGICRFEFGKLGEPEPRRSFTKSGQTMRSGHSGAMTATPGYYRDPNTGKDEKVQIATWIASTRAEIEEIVYGDATPPPQPVELQVTQTLPDSPLPVGPMPWQATTTNDPGVDRIEFRVDDALVATEGSAPWEPHDATTGLPSFDTSALAAGEHTFKVEAFPTASGASAVDVDTRTVAGVTPPPDGGPDVDAAKAAIDAAQAELVKAEAALG